MAQPVCLPALVMLCNDSVCLLLPDAASADVADIQQQLAAAVQIWLDCRSAAAGGVNHASDDDISGTVQHANTSSATWQISGCAAFPGCWQIVLRAVRLSAPAPAGRPLPTEPLTTRQQQQQQQTQHVRNAPREVQCAATEMLAAHADLELLLLAKQVLQCWPGWRAMAAHGWMEHGLL